jgi:hypothetical protein
MSKHSSALTAFVVAITVSLLLASAGAAAPLPDYRGDRISTVGTITSMSREGDQYRIVLNHGSYAYFVPVSSVVNRDIRVGDQVRIGGTVNGDVVNSDFIAFSGQPAYARDPAYRGVPYGQSGWMTGTVVRLHQHYGYLELRDDATGLPVKIDVRNMDEKRSVNVWRTRPGDHITVNGSWSKRDTFQANQVVY